jgi:hypothetical protein
MRILTDGSWKKPLSALSTKKFMQGEIKTEKSNFFRDLTKPLDKSINPDAKLDLFNRNIELIGDLTHDQRVELLKIADTCPIMATLNSKNVIDSALIEQPGHKSGKSHHGHKVHEKGDVRPTPQASNW